jgi:hypothetical protein
MSSFGIGEEVNRGVYLVRDFNQSGTEHRSDLELPPSFADEA